MDVIQYFYTKQWRYVWITKFEVERGWQRPPIYATNGAPSSSRLAIRLVRRVRADQDTLRVAVYTIHLIEMPKRNTQNVIKPSVIT